jgi:hypothetical protein
VREECFGDLTVVYTFGPDFGRRVVTHADLDQLQLHPRMLRQSALQHLEVLSSRAEFHGQPPALMLSFEGLESSLLLATDFWSRLEGAVPGELIVGVPARDVVIVTGSQSGPGLEKAKRCVERVFFAGGEHLIARGLMVRRGGTWEPFDRSARPSGRPTFGPAHQHGVGQPPRQYQEHPSWPGERVPLQPAGAGRRMAPGRQGPVRRRPMHPMAPAAQLGLDSTGAHRLGMTGSHAPISAMTGPAMPVSRQAEPAYRDYAAEVAEAAQYSAVPYSAMPYSASPYSIAPQSVAPNSVAAHSMAPAQASPQSVAPYSAVPYSTVPYQRSLSTQDTGSWYQEKSPASSYQEDLYTTGSMPRSAYPDYDSAVPETSVPAYPASWGSAPDPAAAVRPEFRSGPRARFSR